ncbi:acetoacetate--CoA ligase [Citricoccus sp. NPDC055426]|uniref:acetoacetate--CoA ligase n=1 Tax=Citricoccus sp. NPDC055426 TaxID=3155536 RepID=UPI00341D65BE
MSEGQVLWRPSAERIETANVTQFITWLEENRNLKVDDYNDLWSWSVDQVEEFWGAIAEFVDIKWHVKPQAVLGNVGMPGAQWFPGSKLNYAEHSLRTDGAASALVSVSEDGSEKDLTFGELREKVARARAGLLRLGVSKGDRVASVLPNIQEAVVAFLASASIGAIWTLCSPDYGFSAIRDRFLQVAPKVLIGVNGYVYNGKGHSTAETVHELARTLPSVEHTVVIENLGEETALPERGLRWSELLSETAPLEFASVEFDHPLWILYSSGTTGLPKALVHGHGGVLLEHYKHLTLHHDLGPGSRFFWFTSSGWVMWNLSMSALITGSSVVTFDGNPGYPDANRLWSLVDRRDVTFFGTSPAFLDSCAKADLHPSQEFEFKALQTLGSTGSPLTSDGFEWIYREVKEDLLVVSSSGGTDIASSFVGAVPILPVRSGRIQSRFLGAEVRAFDSSGRSVEDEVGELVLTKPLPSMPVFLWGDDDGSRLRDSYYDMYPGVWRHGDWVKLTGDGEIIILGRSDSTLNRGGIRMGTSEFYSVVERFPGIAKSLVIDTNAPGETSGALLLFVALEDEVSLTDDYVKRLRSEIRTQLSPRHAPDAIVEVTDIPTTITGKKCEVPIKRILAGDPVDSAVALDSLANPESVDQYVEYATKFFVKQD